MTHKLISDLQLEHGVQPQKAKDRFGDPEFAGRQFAEVQASVAVAPWQEKEWTRLAPDKDAEIAILRRALARADRAARVRGATADASRSEVMRLRRQLDAARRINAALVALLQTELMPSQGKHPPRSIGWLRARLFRS